MNIQKLITASEVISTAFVDQNLGTEKIKDEYIEVAQESFLRPILGDDFYDEVLANYNESPYTTLITQFKSALAYYVKYLALPEVMVHITNKGALMAYSGSSNPVDSKGRGDVRAVCLQMAENYAAAAVRWLQSDTVETDYPTYYRNQNIKNRIGNRKGGLVL